MNQTTLPCVQTVIEENNKEQIHTIHSELNIKFEQLLSNLSFNEQLKVSEHVLSVLDGFLYLKQNSFHGSVTARRSDFKTCQKIVVNATLKKTIKNINQSEIVTSELKILDKQYNK